MKNSEKIKTQSPRPLRVLIISGSARRESNCPGLDSKSRALMQRMTARMPKHWEIDTEDLGNLYGREKIQSCNACVSTSMALCVWPCNCYEKDSKDEPDLMWNLDLYARLDLADAWAIIAPINWYGPTSNLKLMSDRLVCMNGGNPREDLIDQKDHEKAMQLEHTAEWRKLSRNHLEGRTAGFFFHGDGGAEEDDETGRPRILRHKSYFDPGKAPGDLQAYGPMKWQFRYSGIEVPEHLYRLRIFGHGKPYSDNQTDDLKNEIGVLADFDSWTDDFIDFVARKGKVRPGKYRAYGLERKPRNNRPETTKNGH